MQKRQKRKTTVSNSSWISHIFQLKETVKKNLIVGAFVVYHLLHDKRNMQHGNFIESDFISARQKTISWQRSK